MASFAGRASGSAFSRRWSSGSGLRRFCPHRERGPISPPRHLGRSTVQQSGTITSRRRSTKNLSPPACRLTCWKSLSYPGTNASQRKAGLQVRPREINVRGVGGAPRVIHGSLSTDPYVSRRSSRKVEVSVDSSQSFLRCFRTVQWLESVPLLSLSAQARLALFQNRWPAHSGRLPVHLS